MSSRLIVHLHKLPLMSQRYLAKQMILGLNPNLNLSQNDLGQLIQRNLRNLARTERLSPRLKSERYTLTNTTFSRRRSPKLSKSLQLPTSKLWETPITTDSTLRPNNPLKTILLPKQLRTSSYTEGMKSSARLRLSSNS